MADTAGWLIFSTAIGDCGVAWSEHGLTRFLLPDTASADMQAVLQSVSECVSMSVRTPSWLRLLVQQVRKHCKGVVQDFSATPVQLDFATDFMQAVYRQAQKIPPGSVISYAQLAAQLGNPGAVRAVGSALGKNVLPLIIPCHRVVAANKKPGGFTSPGGLDTKRVLLACEGVSLELPQQITTARAWRKAVDCLQQEKGFSQLFKWVGDMPHGLPEENDPLTVFVDAIVSQQLSTKVAAVISQRVRTLVARNGVVSAKKILATPDVQLRDAGLSNMKVSYLKDLAWHSESGLLPSCEEMEHMTDEAIIRRFTAVKGVGRWTVEMYLIFGLGRADVFPVDDYGIRKAIARLYRLPALPSAKEIVGYGEHWRPYRSVASRYLWRSLDAAV